MAGVASKVFGSPFLPWAAFTLGSYYLVKKLPSTPIRLATTICGAAVLTQYTVRYLPPFYMSSMMSATLCWLTSIRIAGFMTLPDPERLSVSLKDYIFSFGWFLFPVSKNPDAPRPIPDRLLHCAKILSFAVAKVFIGDFTYRWLLQTTSATAGGGEEIFHHYFQSMPYYAMFYAMILTGTVMGDLQSVLTTLISGDRYRILHFTDWPILGTSVRDVWSRRFNRLVGTLLHESVFTPMLRSGFSATESAIAAFAVSGLLHAHIVIVSFDAGVTGALTALSFFLLHGTLCALEKPLQWKKYLFLLQCS